MSLERRGFVRAVGLGTAGLLSTPFIVGRGSEAAAFELGRSASGLGQMPYDDGIIRISSNENARGPGERSVAALTDAVSPRMGRGYPPDHTNDFRATLAEGYGVPEEHVLIGTGSGGILAGATRAFCSSSKPLVTAAPTYGTPHQTAERLGIPVKMIPVDGSLGLDVGAMADAARGAGMVFFCNPNNPTGTAHSADVVEDFVRTVKRTSPQTRILLDEAYIEYVADPSVRTAAALTQEIPGVFITRSFSKAHGMAGLRVGYAIGQEETLADIGSTWNLGSMNTLSAAAAMASFKDKAHIEAERRENARIRDFTLQAFRDLGYEAPTTHTNFVFVNLGFPAKRFRDACLEHKVRVGRDFPPMEQTHCRISLGTMEEMEAAVSVFQNVLTEYASSR